MNKDKYISQGEYVSHFAREHTDMGIVAAHQVKTFAVKLAQGKGIVPGSKKVERGPREGRTITLPPSIWGDAYKKMVEWN